MLMGDIIRRNAKLFSDKTAIVFEGKKYSYGELDDRVKRLANGLRAKGIGKGDRVGLLEHPCPQYIELYNTEKDHWWFRGRRRIISECLRLFCPQKVERALDIGCGTGFNAVLLGNFSKNVFGLDFSDVAADLAKKLNPDFTLIKGEFPEIKLDEQYNVITLLDVLEHIEDDVAALFDKYNLRSLPVVDAEQKLVGIITVDDVVSRLWQAHR